MGPAQGDAVSAGLPWPASAQSRVASGDQWLWSLGFVHSRYIHPSFVFWAALIFRKPGPVYQRTGAYLHACCVHKIIRHGAVCFVYVIRAPRANLQPQQGWWTGHNVGPENHSSSSWFPCLISWVMSWKFSLSLDLIYSSHLCFNCCAGFKDFLFPLSRYFFTREARKMTKGKKKKKKINQNNQLTQTRTRQLMNQALLRLLRLYKKLTEKLLF